MFDRLSEQLTHAFNSIRGRGKITGSNIEKALGEVRAALLEADVDFQVAVDLVAQTKEKALGRKILRGLDPRKAFIKILRDELTKAMGEKPREIDLKGPGPLPIILVGLNGQGKTTFAGKLAHFLKKKHKASPLLVPADTTRPGAKDQLALWAQRAEASLFDSDLSQSPREIALKALEQARDRNHGVVMIDTAGRPHRDAQLMDHIREVKEALDHPGPEILLVVDGLMGREALPMAKAFQEAVGVTGVVLSKMDFDTRGGAALSIRRGAGVPIRFMSTGEKIGDLDLFHPDRLAGRILGLGDVVSLVEKAQEVVDEKEADTMARRLERGKFSIDDFLRQMDTVAKMGGLSSLVKMIPGAQALGKLRDGGLLEGEVRAMRVMANSMTPAERADYKLIGDSRRRRIARGAGTTPKAVGEFLLKFAKMERALGPMVRMAKAGLGPSFPGLGPSGFGQKMRRPKRKRGSAWDGGLFNK